MLFDSCSNKSSGRREAVVRERCSESESKSLFFLIYWKSLEKFSFNIISFPSCISERLFPKSFSERFFRIFNLLRISIIKNIFYFTQTHIRSFFRGAEFLLILHNLKKIGVLKIEIYAQTLWLPQKFFTSIFCKCLSEVSSKARCLGKN